MQPNLAQPPRDAGPRPIARLLKFALALSLVGMAVSFAKFAARNRQPAPSPNTTGQTAPSPAELAPPKQPTRPRAIARRVPVPPSSASLPARDFWPRGQLPPDFYAFVSPSSSNLEYVVAGRMPELRTGWGGLLASADHPVFYKIPPEYYDELRGDLGRIAEGTNLLQQSETELQTLTAAVEQNRQEYLRHARATDTHRQDEAAGAMKRLLDLQALYQERKQEFQLESARVKPQLQDAPDVFDKKLPLYERAAERYAEDMKQLEAALYAVQKELYETNQMLRGVSRNIEAAWEQSAQDALGQLNVLSNRLQERLGAINTLIHDYNAKLSRYGRPLGTPR